jgi:chorismate dehydratase
MTGSSLIRASAVEYLNTLPIVYGLKHRCLPHRFDLTYAVPSVCAGRLAEGHADVALIPSIEYSRIRREVPLRIVPGIAIASRGPVRSVEFFFNRGLDRIQTVAVDSGSRTSVALMRIILGEKYDTVPELIPMEPDVDRMLASADAALIIGDRALELCDRMDNRLDLGEEWRDLTDNLPFVYSFWAGREDALTTADVEMLQRSRDLGLQHVDEIAQQWGTPGGHPADYYSSYLRDSIQYHLGGEELDGLREFLTYCYYYGLIDEIPELMFYPQLETALN